MLRWQVGEATITSIVESETPTSPRFIFTDQTKESILEICARKPWLRPAYVSDEGYLNQKIQALLIEVDGLKVCVDTCVGNDKERGNPGWNHLDGPFLQDLAATGCDRESIDYIVCTHLHVDHVGWNTMLVDGEWVPTFPNARYLFVRAEYEHWMTGPDLMGDDVFGDSVKPIHEAGLADLVSADHRISESLSFDSTPGHTPGHISLVVSSVGKQAIITGDMMHTPIQIAVPELSSTFDTDSDAARVTRIAALKRWADGETLVIGTHFGTPTAGLLVADGEGSYRLDS